MTMMLELLKADAKRELKAAKECELRGWKGSAKYHAECAHKLHLEISKLEEALEEDA